MGGVMLVEWACQQAAKDHSSYRFVTSLWVVNLFGLKCINCIFANCVHKWKGGYALHDLGLGQLQNDCPICCFMICTWPASLPCICEAICTICPSCNLVHNDDVMMKWTWFWNWNMSQIWYRVNPNWPIVQKVHKSKSQPWVKLWFLMKKVKKCHFDWQGFRTWNLYFWKEDEKCGL